MPLVAEELLRHGPLRALPGETPAVGCKTLQSSSLSGSPSVQWHLMSSPLADARATQRHSVERTTMYGTARRARADSADSADSSHEEESKMGRRGPFLRRVQNPCSPPRGARLERRQ